MNKIAFITMDVESYYDAMCMKRKFIQEEKEYNCASEVGKFINYLNEQGIKSTLFLNIDFLKSCFDDIKLAKETGHEIALHCLSHRDLSRLSNDDFSFMIDESKKIFENYLGFDPAGFRFPCFKYREEQIDILKNKGFTFDSSLMKKAPKDYEKINNIIYKKDGFHEFGLNRNFLLGKKVVFSGGGLLRMLPWNYARKKIRKIAKNSDAYLFYIHPFEICEGELPVYKSLPFYDRIYVSRHRKEWFSFFKEIIEILKEEGYTFMTMSQYIKENN